MDENEEQDRFKKRMKRMKLGRELEEQASGHYKDET